MILSLLLSTLAAHAALNIDLPRGENIVRFAIPGKAEELCFIPKHLPGADYGKKDAQREAELCGYEVGTTVAACPKDNSTNPGVNFHSIPDGMTAEQVTAKECEVPNPENPKKNLAKKEAKYKLSTSCSYTPSILGYYHFSRALGDIVNVPNSVLRTMDLDRHIALAKWGVETTKPGDLINTTWKGLLSALEKGNRSDKADLLLTERADQSYGALSRNPRGEEVYKEFFNGGSDRVATFKAKNPIYKALTTPNLSVGREFTAANVQAMVQLRDAADFILLDTILGQQDRFGNIHAEEKYFYLKKNKKGEIELSSKDKLKEVPEELQGSVVKAKEMILKDNDCGVAKSNLIKDGKLLNDVAHMSPKTYRYLLQLSQQYNTAEFTQLLGQELLFTEKDIQKVGQNLKEAVAMLQGACRAGKLKLDLDLDLYFSGAALPTQYDCQ